VSCTCECFGCPYTIKSEPWGKEWLLLSRCSINASHLAAFVKYGPLQGEYGPGKEERHALFDHRTELYMTGFKKEKAHTHISKSC
jgi:hypothetical protein